MNRADNLPRHPSPRHQPLSVPLPPTTGDRSPRVGGLEPPLSPPGAGSGGGAGSAASAALQSASRRPARPSTAARESQSRFSGLGFHPETPSSDRRLASGVWKTTTVCSVQLLTSSATAVAITAAAGAAASAAAGACVCEELPRRAVNGRLLLPFCAPEAARDGHLPGGRVAAAGGPA